MGVKIQELIDVAVEKGVSAWIEYPPIEGFEVHVAFVGKEEMFRMSDAAKRTTWRKHVKMEEVDRKVLSRKWSAKAILDWRGLTLSGLRELIPIKVDKSDLGMDVPCDEENKFTLLFNSTTFDIWLTDVSTSPEYFIEDVKKRRSKAEELKN